MKDHQAELFDRLAARDCLYEYKPEALAAVDGLVRHKGRLLDIGCGDGTLGAALDSDLVIGIDLSERCARLALRKNVQALVADAIGALPFASESFDTIYCIDVLHHLGEALGPVFTEIERVLRPSGALVIVEPDARNPLVRWTQAPDSPIRVAPFNNEPAIYPETLLPHLEQRGYVCGCEPFQLEARQVVRNVFPLWQRLLKAPFVIALAYYCRRMPNKFLITARKPKSA
jgi:SAM-dependent methyltransferase